MENEIEKAIEVLKKSNELLDKRIGDLQRIKIYIAPIAKAEYYNNLEYCKSEYHAVKLAISALEKAQERIEAMKAQVRF
jgi:prefoldin subunit 5